jgi:glycosyltransferase involved in cell wall biosynthesis
MQISLLGSDDPSSLVPSLWGISTAMKRACFRKFERIIGLSRALTDSCRRAGITAERVVRIPNGVDLAHFHLPTEPRATLRGRLALDVNRRYLVFVGSALHRKGIDVAARAFAIVASQIPDVDLLIVGPCDFSDQARHDPSRHELVMTLRTELNQQGHTNRVHWVGAVSNVVDYLQASSLFFFPTRREGLPNAVAEAMGCGLPVLASRLEGITTDLVDDGVEGRLIVGHDVDDYAAALLELLSDSVRLEQMGIAGRRRVEAEFDLHKIAPQYVRLYEQLRHPNSGR